MWSSKVSLISCIAWLLFPLIPWYLSDAHRGAPGTQPSVGSLSSCCRAGIPSKASPHSITSPNPQTWPPPPPPPPSPPPPPCAEPPLLACQYWLPGWDACLYTPPPTPVSPDNLFIRLPCVSGVKSHFQLDFPWHTGSPTIGTPIRQRAP